MRIPLDRRPNHFVEADTFLHALLGLLSYGRRFEATLTALASNRRPAPAPAPRDTRRDGADDASVLLLLGALGLWQRVRSVLEGWGEDAGRTTGASPRRAPAARALTIPRSLFR